MQQIFTILPHENFLRTATKHHRSKSETTRSKSQENLLKISSPESQKKLETRAKEICTAARRQSAHTKKACIIPNCNGRLETSSFQFVMSRDG